MTVLPGFHQRVAVFYILPASRRNGAVKNPKIIAQMSIVPPFAAEEWEMTNATDFKPFATVRRLAVLALAAAGLGGCVYYPSGYGYNSGYYAPAVTVVPPPVVVGGWWGWGGGDDD